MGQSNVIVVMLRRPVRGIRYEMRSDPFWEFGSFGCTGCHARSLLHPARARAVEGTRLAFAQGGPAGFRLVLLTPPVRVRFYRYGCEARWRPARMPMRYTEALLLVDNEGRTAVPSLKALVAGAKRTTWEGRFASAFRTRCVPLTSAVGAALVAAWEARCRRVPPGAFARDYTDALPFMPPCIDRNRRTTYRSLVRKMGAVVSRGRCRRPGRRRADRFRG